MKYIVYSISNRDIIALVFPGEILKMFISIIYDLYPVRFYRFNHVKIVWCHRKQSPREMKPFRKRLTNWPLIRCTFLCNIFHFCKGWDFSQNISFLMRVILINIFDMNNFYSFSSKSNFCIRGKVFGYGIWISNLSVK